MLDLLGTRKRTVAEAKLPLATLTGLRRHHPDLTDEEASVVADGLRQWYRVAQLAGLKPISMPSRIVDDLWHEHIVCTRQYAGFCQKAFGRFLHHQPESTMTPEGIDNQGAVLRATWDLARTAHGRPGPPVLFEIDQRLGVQGGRRYIESCGTTVCSAGFAVCYAHLPVKAARAARSSRYSADPGSGSSGFDGGSTSGSGCGGSTGCGSSCGGGSSGCGGGCGSS